MCIYHRVMCPNNTDRVANSVEPDQTCSEQSGLRLHYLHGPVSPKTSEHYSKFTIVIKQYIV